MIRVRVGELAGTGLEAVVRPMRSGGEAVSAAGRRLEVAAGAAVGERLRALGDLPVGGAVITPGGDLPVPFIIHVVVQGLDEGVSSTGVRRALVNALRRAREWGIRSLALPPLGTGAGNLDVEEAAGILVDVLRDHARETGDPGELEVVVETGYEEEVFRRTLSGMTGPTP